MGAPALEDFYNATQQVAQLANVPASQIVQVGYDKQGNPVFETVSNLNNEINTIATDIYNSSPNDPRYATADPNSPSGYSVFNDPVSKFDLLTNYRKVNDKYVPLYDLEPLQFYNQKVNPMSNNAYFNPVNPYTRQLDAFTSLLNPASQYAQEQGNPNPEVSMGDNYSVGYDTTNY